ncbi:MAG: hypothetical protein IKE63_02650 [Bacilli bacterium]|nr:hypothetical protein [Bacilli bacterium]
MGYRLDNKDIDISGKRLTKIGNGGTGDVYKYRNSALKIFKTDKETPMDVETAEYLTTISTNRVLLPRNLLFYNNTFRGYTYKLVSKKGSGKKITTIPKDELVGNISIIERDIETLSNKQVLLDGIEPANTIFNGNLYLTDPCKYTKLDIYSTKELEKLNKYQFHLLLISMISSELKKAGISSKLEKQVKELLNFRDENENSSDFLIDIIDDNDSIKQLIKKLQ